MKKNFWLLLAALFLAVIPACEDSDVTPDDPVIEEDAELSLLPATDYEFPAAGGDKTIMVTCNTDWTVESDQDWCTVAVTDDTNFVISAAALTEEGVTREAATVTVSAGDVTKTIGITQKEFAADQELVFEATNTTYTGTDFTITPTKEDIPYVVYTFPSFQYADLSDEDLMAAIITSAGSLDAAAVTGTYSYTNENLNNPATDYIVVAFGWQDNDINGEFNRFTYSTEASSNATCSFTGVATNVETTTATFTITPADEYVTYTYAYATGDMSDWTQDDMNSAMTNWLQSYITSLEFDLRTYGTNVVEYTGLNHSTQHTVLLAPTDQYGDLTGDVVAFDSFTTATPEYADGLNNWLGTWTITSTSSEINGGPLTIECVIVGGDTDTELYLYGWDIHEYRWDYPVIAEYDEYTGGWYIENSVVLFTDTISSIGEGTFQYTAMCWLDSYSAWYFISGDYTALTAEIGANGASATVTGTELTISTGDETVVANVVFSFWLTDDSGSIYTFNADSSLGFDSSEMLVGPFTMTKVSDSTTFGAPAKAQAVDSPFSDYCYASSAKSLVGKAKAQPKNLTVHGFMN